MVERHFYRFSSVDFFGKSMPGLLFTLFGVLFLPESLYTSVVSFVDTVNLAVVVSVFFIIIVVGFTAGQGINTIAIILQKILYTTGYVVSEYVRSHGARDYDYWAEIKLVDLDGIRDEGSRVRLFVLAFKYWLWKRYINIKRGFVPHRIIFNDWIRRHLSDKRPDQQPKIDVLLEKYEAYAEDISGRSPSVPDPDPDEHINQITVPEDVYLLISSYVTHQGPVQSRRHKALFVFCQNTAIVFIVYTILTALVALDVTFDQSRLLTNDYDTVIAHLFIDEVVEPLYLLPGILLCGALVFIYAIGVYKKMYLEYLIMDFVSHTRDR